MKISDSTTPEVGGGAPREDGGVLVIEPEDEGEVLLLKIQQLKQEMSSHEELKLEMKQELRSFEEQLKASTSPRSSKAGFKPPSQEHKQAGRSFSAGANAAAAPGNKAPKDESKSNALDAYELLEEKHRLSYGTKAAGGNAPKDESKSNALDAYELLEEKHRLSRGAPAIALPAAPSKEAEAKATNLMAAQSERTDVTSAVSDFSRTTADEEYNAKIMNFSVPPRDSKNEAPALPNRDMIPPMQRGQRLREDSLPGAVSVAGIGVSSSTSTSQQDGTNRLRINEMDEETALNDQQPPGSNGSSETGMLVEADLVDETNAGPLVSAKRDPWYRRNQWWLTGALVLIIASIILAVVLTSVDLSPAQAPTMSPTSEFNGVETDTEALVLSSFPAAAASLADEFSSQTEALRWVTKQRFNDPSLFSSPTRILQQYALASLYFSTLGESAWSQKDGWLNTTNECEWYGIECEDVGEGEKSELVVVRVALPSNNASGRIPPDLSILSTGLKALDLSMNRLTASIPSELAFLTSLDTLDLSSNGLVGGIPTLIDALTKLEILDLSSNVLTGSIPSEIANLELLQSLNIKENALIGDMPSEVGRLAKLKYFNCESNNLAFAIPTEIGRLSKLESLHVGNNAFVGSLPSELGLLENIVSLHLSENSVAGTIPYHIMLLTNLQSLDLSFNLLSGQVPRNVGMLRSLTSLILSNNDLKQLVPPSIGAIQGLTHLDVSGNDFQHNDIASSSTTSSSGNLEAVPWDELAQLTNLVHLDLSGAVIGNYNFELLQLTNLEVLGLSGSNIGGSLSVPSFLLSLTVLLKIRKVDLSRNNIFTTHLPSEMGFLTNLEVLDLHGNRLSGSLPTEIGALSNLSVLNLESCEFTGTLPSEIPKLTNLVDLNLAGGHSEWFRNPLSGTISPSFGQLTKLRRLNLGSSDISGTIPSELGLTQLEELHLQHTRIRGWIPTEIQSLTRLRSLSLRETSVSGSIPEFDGTFSKLENLDLFSTMLTGSIPPGLWSLSMLTLLEIGGANHISGMIPPMLAGISNLATLNLAGINMAGSTLPSEIGLMSNLRVLHLSDSSLSGTIPTELFQCTQLSSLRMGGNSYAGSLPSELGLVTNLLDLQMPNATITGNIPTEIGNLRLLEMLDLSNTDIDGVIPSELSGRLLLLSHLNLTATHTSGPIPADISSLLSLRTLSLSYTDMTGEIPSTIAMLANFETFEIADSLIYGTVPLEMANMESIATMDFRDTNITGLIPDILCLTFSYIANGAPALIERKVYIDCEEVDCNCCECEDEIIFLELPPMYISTPMPSTSISPTTSPSNSVSPSESFMPTGSRACTPFESIADIGTGILTYGCSQELTTIALPFPFHWRGQSEYSVVSVSPNGVIILGDAIACETCGYYQDCCTAFPVGEFPDFGLPRIVLGQTILRYDLYHSVLPANVYYATVGDTFVISYEGASFPPTYDLNLYFQAVLYPNGDIQMRWGQGFPEEGIDVSVGLEDGDMAIPASGHPFDARGVSALGTWPAHQCRTFITTSDGNYTEYDPPTVAPSVSLAPSTSSAPTIDSPCMQFSSIAAIGTLIDFCSNGCDDKETVFLPFNFKWRGEESGLEYTAITVSENGAIFLGDFNECPVWCQYDLVTCCSAHPIGELSGSRIPRIALAQQNLKGNAYYATIGEVFVVSFEGVDFVPVDSSGELNLHFQVALFADGRVEMRWGQGFPRYHENIVAGLEGIDLAVPATGAPFGPGGVTPIGEWPTNQCRLFAPTVDGSYTEHF